MVFQGNLVYLVFIFLLLFFFLTTETVDSADLIKS